MKLYIRQRLIVFRENCQQAFYFTFISNSLFISVKINDFIFYDFVTTIATLYYDAVTAITVIKYRGTTVIISTTAVTTITTATIEQ